MPNQPLTQGYYRLFVALLAVVLLLMAGCQAKDRAGGHAGAEVTNLRFALNSLPDATIMAWAQEVDQLSNGTLKITFLTDTRTGQPNAEAGLIADVRAGTVDLAWVGVRAFDQVGLTTFQPLVAPLLIDSLELEGKVFDAGIPQQLLPDVSKLDLVGVGVLPGPIRKVLGVTKPFATPADFTGQVVGIQASAVAERSLTALGATPKPVPGSAELTGLDAYEQQLSSIQGNHYALNAKYVTGNLNLWPRPRVIIANPDVHQRLTDNQRNDPGRGVRAHRPRRHGGRAQRGSRRDHRTLPDGPHLRPVQRQRPRRTPEVTRPDLPCNRQGPGQRRRAREDHHHQGLASSSTRPRRVCSRPPSRKVRQPARTTAPTATQWTKGTHRSTSAARPTPSRNRGSWSPRSTCTTV